MCILQSRWIFQGDGHAWHAVVVLTGIPYCDILAFVTSECAYAFIDQNGTDTPSFNTITKYVKTVSTASTKGMNKACSRQKARQAQITPPKPHPRISTWRRHEHTPFSPYGMAGWKIWSTRRYIVVNSTRSAIQVDSAMNAASIMSPTSWTSDLIELIAILAAKLKFLGPSCEARDERLKLSVKEFDLTDAERHLVDGLQAFVD